MDHRVLTPQTVAAAHWLPLAYVPNYLVHYGLHHISNWCVGRTTSQIR